jgi:hypothetical protein
MPRGGRREPAMSDNGILPLKLDGLCYDAGG